MAAMALIATKQVRQTVNSQLLLQLNESQQMAFVDVSVDPTLARFVLDELNANVVVEIAPTWPYLIKDIDLSFESLDDHANYDA
ncbi:MAG: hypothetical protein RL336_588, partial [Pseudomonadota bacterium]